MPVDYNLEEDEPLSVKVEKLLCTLEAKYIFFDGWLSAMNLIAGGFGLGNDPKILVLDKNYQAHEVDNLYVTDYSCMPRDGSEPYYLMLMHFAWKNR